ncbi:hypothetical protein MTO96_014734 [Rhipicephalus appendiculatus]
MSEHADSGQPLKMADVDADGNLQLDERSLAHLLLDERVKDKPVVVIATAWAFHTGKSFLLSFLLRYLRNFGRADWLGDPDAPLGGFEWRQGGSERHTSGILVWNEVFLVKTSEGKELAVLLVDTQGTFNSRASGATKWFLLALSGVISSVLVYNVSQDLREDDLRFLRDLLQYCMPMLSEQQEPSSDTEEAVDKESSDRRLSDIDETFKVHLSELMRLLLEPDNLRPKKIDGRAITCSELMSHIMACGSAIKNSPLVDPSELVERSGGCCLPIGGGGHRSRGSQT